MTDDPREPQDELNDDELDEALAAGHADLLEQVRTRGIPISALTALMGATDDDEPARNRRERPPARPAAPGDPDPVTLITWRARCLSHIRAVDQARSSLDALRNAQDLIEMIRGDRPAAREVLLGVVDDLALVPHLDPSYLRELTEILRAGDIGDVDRARARAWVYAGDFVKVLRTIVFRDLDTVRSSARLLGRYFSRELGVDFRDPRDRARRDEIARELEGVRERALDLCPREVNAAGADLSGLQVTDLDDLVGVVWDRETRWPPGLRERVAAYSEEIASGVYRVVPYGPERDPVRGPVV
ncbi:hypothetical protein [Actinoallomurus iriomotensis]|uniref:Uncharacterized protein n=1 Tax=Actinoallomurus iriomotensis TaxID=478107 RepID=A0A9W6S5L8_9ACTN|nr:hypothetical protein [Actinoallomurus iriomotensis]GLY87631.1 hypothetical protein Airi02_055600 [Actinoallomurus iriomotensis]